MTVMRMFFTICIGREYLLSVMNHREPSSRNLLDLRTAQNSHAPVHAVRHVYVEHNAWSSRFVCRDVVSTYSIVHQSNGKLEALTVGSLALFV